MNRKKALSDTDREIIRKMADYNLTMSQVARDMFMHWNTVVFHCRSIKRITGYDPRNFYGEVQLLKLLEEEESDE